MQIKREVFTTVTFYFASFDFFHHYTSSCLDAARGWALGIDSVCHMNHSLSLSTKCLLSYFYCWLSHKGIKCPKKALRQTQKLSCSSLAETLIYSSSAMLHLHSIYVQYRYKTLVASPGCRFFTIYSVSCVFFNSPLSALCYFIKICWTFDSDFDAVLQHVKLLVEGPLLLVYSSPTDKWEWIDFITMSLPDCQGTNVSLEVQ